MRDELAEGAVGPGPEARGWAAPVGRAGPSWGGGQAARRLLFDDVSHCFPDGTDVLHHVSLTVHQGEFVAVIGPSGCGKSTLLRLASGLLKPTAGRIECDRADIGFVFQEPTLLPFRTVVSNVELFGELKGIRKPERRRLALEALARVGLEGFEDKYPKALSGGMKMRASLARSLILHPTLFLFDEPFAAVDEITRQRLNDDLAELFSREGFAAVFITHSVAEACYLASRVVVMSRRPAHILAEVDIPFAFPRSEDLRFDPSFSQCAREVSARLRESGA
jgi:NitT/TauT family transport system ATP-binding protein